MPTVDLKMVKKLGTDVQEIVDAEYIYMAIELLSDRTSLAAHGCCQWTLSEQLDSVGVYELNNVLYKLLAAKCNVAEYRQLVQEKIDEVVASYNAQYTSD